MAAAAVTLTSQQLGVFHVKDVPAASSQRANELLQVNHDQFHIVWNAARNLHNHQTHYLLTYLALGATPEQLQHAFESNENYMRKIDAGDPSASHAVTNENFLECLGRDDHYRAWLKFFEARVEQKGWKEALVESTFAQDAKAKQLLYRLYEGALHPLIHLGFGVEFEQPAIIAEALAQAAIHPGWCGPFLESTAKLSLSQPIWAAQNNLKDLILEARQTPAITRAACWDGHSFERNGNFFERLPVELAELAASYKLGRQLSTADLHMRTAELLNVSAWLTCGAQRDGKEAKMDFFLMHTITSSIFFSVFEAQDWLAHESKIELLEYQVRMLLVLFVCQGAAKPRMDLVEKFTTRRPGMADWAQITETAKDIPDDGHVLKVIRALNHGYLVCAEDQFSTDDLHGHFPLPLQSWITAAQIVVDSTIDHPTTLGKWMRGPGWSESWDVVPDKK